MECGEARTGHKQEKCPEILVRPEKLPSLFFLKETIPGGVLQETESLAVMTASANDRAVTYPTHAVLVKSYPEVELPSLSVNSRNTEHVPWLQETVDHNSGNRTVDFALEGEEVTNNHVCDNLGFDEVESHCFGYRDHLCERKKPVQQIDDQIKSNEEKSDSNSINKEGMFYFCSKHLFLLLYIVLGTVIMFLAVLNLVFGFKPILLISLIVMVFLLLVLLTD